ncbi:type VI immunity family protein [Burkholderia contaminans]|uniref:type VI immunity family protein n=1 Tax=Burkholderia contaminans TaxID=488447 RepID=UPI0024A0E854|nr:type VI immunity family protein [Burkholderia contaminans]GLZ73489.1 hypothetical protein Bcon01_65340 [Burkholderia contaminans]
MRPDARQRAEAAHKDQDGGWLYALDAELVRDLGGALALGVQPDWFVKQPLGAGGLLIQAGAAPEAGISMGPGKPAAPAAAYVLLKKALRPIVIDALDPLQDGALDSTAPLLNTKVATESWLRRFDVPEDQINAWWVQLHTTPKVTDARDPETDGVARPFGLIGPFWIANLLLRPAVIGDRRQLAIAMAWSLFEAVADWLM